MPEVILSQPMVDGPLAIGDYLDLSMPNFGLRVGKTKRMYFVRCYEPDGTRPRVKLGLTSVLRLKEARIRAAERMRIHDEGGTVQPPIVAHTAFIEGKLNPHTVTVRQLCEAYIEDRKGGWSPSYLKDQIFYSSRIVIPAWGHLLAKDIERHQVKAIARGYALKAPTGANRLHAFISALFRWADDEDLLVGDPPTFKIRKPSKEKSRERLLSAGEVGQFWKALQTISENPEASPKERAYADIWRLRLLTAQREQSLRRLEWSWIHWADKLIDIPAEAMKGKTNPHLVPLGPMALALLKARKASASKLDKFIFGTRDASAKAPGKTRGRPIELPNFRGHDLRRTGTTLMTQHGVTPFEVARVLNHKDASVTGIYNRYAYFPEKKRALDILDRVLAEIIAPKKKRAGEKSVLAFKRA